MRMLGTTLPLRLVTTANARVISRQRGEGLARPWSSSTSRPAGALPQRPRLSPDPLPKVPSPEWHDQEEEETLQIFDLEPLPAEHPFRHLQNVLATPHIGYGSRSLYETFYRDAVANIRSWFLGNEGRLK